MWTIDTPTGAIILVGEIRAIPETTPWQPDRLKDATGQASRVILGAKPKISPGDVLRLMFSGSKFTKLPDKTEAREYLDDAQWARLAALGEAHDEDYARKSFPAHILPDAAQGVAVVSTATRPTMPPTVVRKACRQGPRCATEGGAPPPLRG